MADNVATTLRRMGHTVLTRTASRGRGNYSTVLSAYSHVRRRISTSYISSEERWLLKNLPQFRPDLLLALTQQISEETLQECKNGGVKYRVAWWADSPANMSRLGLFARGWDFLFFKDSNAVLKFRMAGFNAFLLHEAMNPLWHRPVATSRNEEVAVVGNYYNFRQFLVERLVNSNVKVGLYGGDPPAWSIPVIQKLHRREYVARERKSKVFGESLACLNTTSLAEGNSLNCRAFEIAGAGGLPLMEARPVIADCFDIGSEILVFSTFEELLSLIDRTKRFPSELDCVRRAAAKRALTEHTYEHRLREILRKCE